MNGESSREVVGLGSVFHFPSFRTPELLFQPGMVGLEAHGIHETVCVWRSFAFLADIDLSIPWLQIRKSLCESVVMSGGTTMFPGIADRMWKELIALMPGMRVTPNQVTPFSAVLKHDLFQDRVIAAPERRHSVWIGESILASLGSFQDLRHTKQEYCEYGPAIIHRCTPHRSIDFPDPCGV